MTGSILILAMAALAWWDRGVHIVIIGCGRVGSGLAAALDSEGHRVVVIDKNRRSFKRLPAEENIKTVVGSGFDRESLIEAGVEKADAVAAVTSGDNSNILCARIARENFHIPNVVARIYDPRRAEIYQRLGIPTVATVTWTIEQVRQWLIPQEDRPAWTDATGSLHLVEYPLPASWAGRSLAALNVAGKITLVAVGRAGKIRLDGAELVGQERDLLHLAVTSEGQGELRRLLGGAVA